LEPRKNLHRLIEAFRFASISRECELVVVGRTGWGSQPTGVRLLSHLSDQQLADCYAAARGVIIPSIYEGFGLPLIEALRMGTPVACSDLPVFHEVTGGDAIFFDPLDIGSIADALQRLAYSHRAGEQAIRRARAFTWDATAAALSALYRRLVH